MGYYLTGQVCLNGHPITSDASSGLSQPFCSECGAATITHCPNCNAAIHGRYEEPSVVVFGNSYKPDAYCYSCGRPYPWTEAAIKNTALVIQEDEELSDTLKASLESSLPDVVSETPGTNLAVIRMKKALATAGKFTVDALRQFAIDFGCELARKSLGL